jgi:homoserine kinase
MEKITVRVPASTSNLGPGFDCLGVALRVYNFVTIVRTQERHRHPPIVEETARLFFKRARKRPFLFSCKIEGDVPRSRGLGGSATVRLGVFHALNVLSRRPLDRSSIFHLCAQLEAHPDNAAPCSFGGFTVAHGENVQRFDVSPRLYFVLLISDLEVKTVRARRILPANIRRVDAVQSLANACAITAAFGSRNYENLRGTFDDRFHQPFRAKLMPFLPRVIAAAEKAGALGAFLSGSGSAICAVTLRNPREIAAAVRRAAKSIPANTIITKADNVGICLNPQPSTLNRSRGPHA